MNAARPISVSSCPEVLVYPDIRDAKRFYAFAAHPRVARDDAGAPQISLMIFGKTSGGRFTASGGQFTGTFGLAVTGIERADIERELDGAIVYPDWIDSKVTVDVTDGVSVDGNASLAGANECVVSAMLTGPQADALRQAWISRSHSMRVEYVVGIRASTQSVASSETVQGHSTAASSKSHGLRVDLSLTQSGRVQMTLEGAIEPGGLNLSRCIQTIGL